MIWLLSGLIALTAVAARPAGLVLTLVEVEEVVNDHVGDEWTHAARVDGWELAIYDQIELASAEAYEIQCVSREIDPHYPDSGSRTVRLTEADLQVAARNGGFTIDVTVTEGHGKYAGNQAVWRYHFALR